MAGRTVHTVMSTRILEQLARLLKLEVRPTLLMAALARRLDPPTGVRAGLPTASMSPWQATQWIPLAKCTSRWQFVWKPGWHA